MITSPLFSIVIPLYKKPDTIVETLLSCVNQDFDDFEIIVVNDGSPDDSVDRARRVYDSRIKIVSQKNAGVSSARNRGVDEARGEWVFCLDADDIISPYTFSLLADVIKKELDAQVIVGQFSSSNSFDKKSSILGRVYVSVNPYKDFLYRNFYPNAGLVLIKRQAYEKVRYINGRSYYEDGIFYLMLMKECPRWVWFNNEILYHPTDGTGLSSVDHPKEVDGAYDLPKRKYESLAEALCYLDLVGQCQWSRVIHSDQDGVEYYNQLMKKNFTIWQRFCFRILCKYKRIKQRLHK